MLFNHADVEATATFRSLTGAWAGRSIISLFVSYNETPFISRSKIKKKKKTRRKEHVHEGR